MKKEKTHRVENEFVGRGDAGRIIGVTPRTIDNMIADGRLRAYRIGRTVRISRADIEAALVPVLVEGVA